MMHGNSGFFLAYILLLAMMGAGSGGIDTVSMVSAKEYFKAREIDPTIEKLIVLAGETPSSGNTLIAHFSRVASWPPRSSR